MPGIYNEYSRPSVTASSCAYAQLDNYSQNYQARGLVGAPVQASSRSNQIVVVPSYGGVGYDNAGYGLGYSTLSGPRRSSCSGYQSMVNAYPSFTNNACGRYYSSLCG